MNLFLADFLGSVGWVIAVVVCGGVAAWWFWPKLMKMISKRGG